MYEIVMPQLSDSMDEGKLIAWKVSVGQAVKSGDVIAEVESDKAIMEVQSFQDGVVAELLVKEDSEVPVGTVIAKIATDQQEQKKSLHKEKKEIHQEKQKETKQVQEPVVVSKIESLHGISPKARAKAAQYGIELQKLMHSMGKSQLHAADIQEYIKEHYFTPKAQKLLQTYQLDTSLFTLDHKIDAVELQAYIDRNEIPLPHAISSMQKAIINSVTISAQKPVFHIYEYGDTTLLEQNSQYSMTAWFIKIFAAVMMQHDSFRSHLYDETIAIYPNASISLAVADKKELYMPVIKDANKLSIAEIDKVLKGFKLKLKNRTFSSQDMQGSTFGISNLGMVGVEQFDAMINKDDTAIAAIGAVKSSKIAITLTVDHRLINGYEAVLFMQDLKKELQNPLNFKK